MKSGERWKRNLLTWLWIQRRQQQQWFWSRWLSSAFVRPLFIGLFVPCSCFQSLFFVFLLSLSVFCVCFSSAFPWFSFCSRYLLCFSFFVCVCPLSLGLFFLFPLALTCSVFLCLFSVLGSVLGWFFLCRDEDDGRVDLWFLSAFLPFSLGILFFCVYALFCSACFLTDFRSPHFLLLCSAFYKAQRACPSNQSWLCRTVIPPRTGLWAENVVTIGSALLPIFQLPCWIGMKKMHDCSPATVPFRQKWKYSLWPLNSLNLTIGILISNNWFLTLPLG